MQSSLQGEESTFDSEAEIRVKDSLKAKLEKYAAKIKRKIDSFEEKDWVRYEIQREDGGLPEVTNTIAEKKDVGVTSSSAKKEWKGLRLLTPSRHSRKTYFFGKKRNE